MPPLKRHKVLVQYSKEHYFGLMLGWKIRQGIAKKVAGKRMARYIIEAFDAEILPHFVNEESQLFVLLPSNDSLRLRAEQEHLSIRQKLEALGNAPATEKLITFATELELHIRFEERELFPHIEQQQSFEVWANAMQTHESSPHADFDRAWDDQFWK